MCGKEEEKGCFVVNWVHTKVPRSVCHCFLTLGAVGAKAASEVVRSSGRRSSC